MKQEPDTMCPAFAVKKRRFREKRLLLEEKLSKPGSEEPDFD